MAALLMKTTRIGVATLATNTKQQKRPSNKLQRFETARAGKSRRKHKSEHYISIIGAFNKSFRICRLLHCAKSIGSSCRMPRAVKAKAGTGAGAGRGGGGAKKAAAPKRNKLYSMPEKIVEGTVLTDLSKGQWCVGPSIGTGGFGEIYSASRVGEKSYDYVVKCEPHGNGPLFVEMHFYMRNAKLEDIQRFQREHGLKSFGMPYMVGHGSVDIKEQKHRFIVMPRYGSDIAKHFLVNGRCLPEGTIYRLALQMLDVYEFIHSCGYVHADLKAANILLGYGKGGGAQAYLVDYGLASHYTTKEFKPDPKKMHNGTIEYTSRDAHQGVATMRADLEILGYNLIEWCGVQLPWVKSNLLAVPTKVQKAKEEFMEDIGTHLKSLFPKGVPVPIAEFMKYVAKLQYNETPDYDKCRKLFANALKVMKISNSGDLEFKMKGDNNNTTPSKDKARPKGPTKRPALSTSSTSSEICASDDDDDDVIFEVKKPVKKAPSKKVLKTIPKPKSKGANVSPKQKILPTLKKSPTPTKTPRLTPLSISPVKRKPLVSPIHKRRSVSASPIRASRQSPLQKKAKPTARDTPLKQSSTPQPASTSKSSRPASLATKANINFSPAISLSTSRPGKTIVNDNTTPNIRAGKTYEFNFELDVSMDANVIVNVKRKKKAPIGTTSKDSVGQGSSKAAARANGHRDDDTESPATRVKVRKLVGDEDVSSPRTPAVTVRKTKRL